eukprot:GHVN01068609.1.p1 GENE.GHVN01068609.1~~GHVN01068609.1.p1  ORF type:complete len:451 (+),score=43.07 GHVN01068609.1:81-1433(+)
MGAPRGGGHWSLSTTLVLLCLASIRNVGLCWRVGPRLTNFPTTLNSFPLDNSKMRPVRGDPQKDLWSPAVTEGQTLINEGKLVEGVTEWLKAPRPLAKRLIRRAGVVHTAVETGNSEALTLAMDAINITLQDPGTEAHSIIMWHLKHDMFFEALRLAMAGSAHKRSFILLYKWLLDRLDSKEASSSALTFARCLKELGCRFDEKDVITFYSRIFDPDIAHRQTATSGDAAHIDPQVIADKMGVNVTVASYGVPVLEGSPDPSLKFAPLSEEGKVEGVLRLMDRGPIKRGTTLEKLIDVFSRVAQHGGPTVNATKTNVRVHALIDGLGVNKTSNPNSSQRFARVRAAWCAECGEAVPIRRLTGEEDNNVAMLINAFVKSHKTINVFRIVRDQMKVKPTALIDAANVGLFRNQGSSIEKQMMQVEEMRMCLEKAGECPAIILRESYSRGIVR